MRSFNKLAFAFLASLLLIITACISNDEEPVGRLESKRLSPNVEDIPEVTSALLDQMGLGNAQGKFSINGQADLGFEINWSEIRQMIDTTGRQTFTFDIVDKNNDPKTFYNLVFRLTANGEPHKPYVLKYTMSDEFAEAYYQGEVSMKNFSGSIQKIIIGPNLSSNRRGSSNDDWGDGAGGNDDGIVVPGNTCPDGSQFNNGSSGSNPSGGGNGGSGDPSDNTTYEICTIYFNSETEETCVSSSNSPDEFCWTTTYSWITYEDCEQVNYLSANIEDDADCDIEDGDVGIIEPSRSAEGFDGGFFNEDFWQNANLQRQNLPKLKTFKDHFPQVNGGQMPAIQVWNLIGGEIKTLALQNNWNNACAARLSYALNKSGITIPEIPGSTFKGADGKNYIVGAKTMEAFLRSTFGNPNISMTHTQAGTNGSNFHSQANGAGGMYIMLANYPGWFGASGHADFYTGSSFIGDGYFNPTGGGKMMLWKLEN